MFNEYEVYQLMKIRQEGIERKAQYAWKVVDIQSETLFQMLVKNFKPKKQLTIVKTNCDSVCCC